MSPPHAGHSSGNSSPTRAISLAQAIREVSCERGFWFASQHPPVVRHGALISEAPPLSEPFGGGISPTQPDRVGDVARHDRGADHESHHHQPGQAGQHRAHRDPAHHDGGGSGEVFCHCWGGNVPTG